MDPDIPEVPPKLDPENRRFIEHMTAIHLRQLEWHCRRLHPKVMQLDGELADDGALIVRATTFVDWPPGSGPHRHTWQDIPFGHMRVWGILEKGVFMLHSYDAGTHVIQRRAMKIRLDGGLVPGKGRPLRTPDPDLIENILKWMQGRLRLGESVDDLREEDYVLYRWPDRYGTEDELLEGKYKLAQMICDRKPKRSVESGKRLLRTHLHGIYTWPMLKALASTKH
jgi:hypothetical protein